MAFHDKHVVILFLNICFICLNLKIGMKVVNKAVMGKTLNKALICLKIKINVCSIEKQREIVDKLIK